MENIRLQKNFGNVSASLNFNFPAYFGIPESKSNYSEHKYKPGIKYLLENWLSVDEVAALFSEAISEAKGNALECLNKALKVFEDMTGAKEDPFTKAWKRGFIEDKGVNTIVRYSNIEENVSILSDGKNAVIKAGAKYGDYNTVKRGKYNPECENSGRVLQVLNHTIEKAVKVAEFRTLKELKKEYGSLLVYGSFPYNMKPYFKYLEDKPTYFGVAINNGAGWMILKQEGTTVIVGKCGKETQEDFHYYKEVKPEEEE